MRKRSFLILVSIYAPPFYCNQIFNASSSQYQHLSSIKIEVDRNPSLREKCPYSEFFWSKFSRIRTEYEEILRISPYSLRMRENADQNSSENGYFLRSAFFEL